MSRPNPTQLDHWLDEEIEALVRSIETEVETEVQLASRTIPAGWFRPFARRRAPNGASEAVRLPVAFSRISWRTLGRLTIRRRNFVFYAFAVAVSLIVGWLIPYLDKP
jgi:hypothetical protein